MGNLMRKKIKMYHIFFAFLLLSGCVTSNVYIRHDIDYSKYQRIAIAPLFDYPQAPGVGLQIADIISAQLIGSEFTIVERSRMMYVLKEQSLGLSGIIDEKTAPAIGSILGVQAVLTGSVNEFRTQKTPMQIDNSAQPSYIYTSIVGISLKLIDCETGTVVWGGTARGTVLGGGNEMVAAQKTVKKILFSFRKLKIGAKSQRTIRKDSDTLLPNFRSKFPKYNKYSDDELLDAFRKKFPQFKTKTDVWLIKYIEKKYKKKK